MSHSPHDHAHHDHGHHHHHHGPEEGPVTFADPAQESLSQALRSGFQVLRVIMVVLLIAYVASGWFRVNPGEQGVIIRFGRLLENKQKGDPLEGTPVFGPGWHFALPDPFDQKVIIPGRTFTIHLDTFLFERPADERGRPLGAKTLAEQLVTKDSLDPARDGAMLTGDRNLSHGLWAIEYRIADASKFVRNVSDSVDALEPLLRRLSEAAIVRTVAGRRVEEVLKYNQPGDAAVDVVADEVRRRLTSELDALDTGVVVTKVTSDTIEPGRVKQAFQRVRDAQQDATKDRDQAETDRTQILNQAAGPRELHEPLIAAIEAYGAAQAAGAEAGRLNELRAQIDQALLAAKGETATILAQARSRGTEEYESVQRELEEFRYYLEQYRKFPEPTARRLWANMRAAVLGSKDNEVFHVPGFGVIEVLINRDQAREREAELERSRRATGRL